MRFFRQPSDLIGVNYHLSGWPWAMAQLAELNTGNGPVFDDFAEATFAYRGDGYEHMEPWIGIFHHPPTYPGFSPVNESPTVYCSTPQFRRSAQWLMGAIVLSHHAAHWFQTALRCPVRVIAHPAAPSPKTWNRHDFDGFGRPTLLQVGHYLRNTQLIYQIPPSPAYDRVRLMTDRTWIHEYDERVRAYWERVGTRQRWPSGVSTLERLDDDAYERALLRSVIVTELFDASANNVLLECIARATPIFINRHPAAVEYLGDTYPGYWECPEQIPYMLSCNVHLMAHDNLMATRHSLMTGAQWCRHIADAAEDFERRWLGRDTSVVVQGPGITLEGTPAGETDEEAGAGPAATLAHAIDGLVRELEAEPLFGDPPAGSGTYILRRRGSPQVVVIDQPRRVRPAVKVSPVYVTRRSTTR